MNISGVGRCQLKIKSLPGVGNQYKNGPVIGQIMSQIIEACENGHDHDHEPVTIVLKHTGFNLNTGFFSRNRDIVGDSSFSVLG